jgi:transposase
VARGDLTDDEWQLISPLFPLAATGPIPDLRSYFNAVMWRFRTGSPWRDVPERYGSWSTIYDRFRMWATDGVFQTVMDAMIAESAARGGVDLSLVSVDSTVARAHHHAAGAVVDSELLAELAKVVEEERGSGEGGNRPGRRSVCL